MKMRLKDIIDLDYLAGRDEDPSLQTAIRQRREQDKAIYMRIRKMCRTDKDLLLTWLDERRKDIRAAASEPGSGFLPGEVFSSIYQYMIYIMAFSGSLSGLCLSWSFLAYHGASPVNVALFIALFVAGQAALILLTVFFLFLRKLKFKAKPGEQKNSIMHALLSSLFFQLLPAFFKKTDSRPAKKTGAALFHASALIRMKSREYQAFFFWPFFILISIFSFCFALGTFCGTFFKIMVSDMAFGWQSTLVTSAKTIHTFLTWMALPWSWMIPENLSLPNLSQIEGSRIILKDGISVLATQNLISWWPFLCLSIFYYAVLPRLMLMATGILAHRRTLSLFDPKEYPLFKALIIGMKSSAPDLEIAPSPSDPEGSKPLLNTDGRFEPSGEKDDSSIHQEPQNSLQRVLVLAPRNVYEKSEDRKILEFIRTRLLLNAGEVIQISLDIEQDTHILEIIKTGHIDQVVLVYEAWQPPIRGLLFYFKQLKSAMPGNMLLWILLTSEASSNMDDSDQTRRSVEIWKNAILTLADSGIRPIRLE